MIIDLAKPDLRKVHVETQVRTTTGHIWTLLDRAEKGETWKDQTSKLTWLPTVTKKINHHDALKLETSEQRLPSKAEFEAAEAHGIREVLDDMDYYFWSSSVHPDYSNDAYYFDGRTGYIFFYDRDNADFYAVRCVARRLRAKRKMK